MKILPVIQVKLLSRLLLFVLIVIKNIVDSHDLYFYDFNLIRNISLSISYMIYI